MLQVALYSRESYHLLQALILTWLPAYKHCESGVCFCQVDPHVESIVLFLYHSNGIPAALHVCGSN